MQKGVVVEKGDIVEVFSAPQAPITKSFIQAADNFEAFSDLVKLNSAITGIKPSQPVWFLTYRGAVAGEPLMSVSFTVALKLRPTSSTATLIISSNVSSGNWVSL